MQFTTNAKQLSKNIAMFAKARKAVANSMHTLAVSCICHAIEHGDVTLINKLDHACRDGMDNRGRTASAVHLSGLREYLVDMGPVKWVRKDKKTGKDEHFAYDPAKQATLKSTYDEDKDSFAKKLLDTPFYAIKGQKEFEGFDLPRILRSALSRLKKVKEDAEKAGHPKNNFDGAEELTKIVALLPAPAKAA